MTKQRTSRRIELQLDRRLSLSFNAGSLEGVNVEQITATAAGAEEAFEGAWKLVCGREMDKTVLRLLWQDEEVLERLEREPVNQRETYVKSSTSPVGIGHVRLLLRSEDLVEDSASCWISHVGGYCG